MLMDSFLISYFILTFFSILAKNKVLTRMRFLIANILLLLLTVTVIKAQPDSASFKPLDVASSKKPVTGFQAGTFMSVIPSYGAAYGFFVGPTVYYPLSKKFFVSGGITASSMIFLAFIPEGEHTFRARPSLNSLDFTATAGYHATGALLFYGSGTRRINLLQVPQDELNLSFNEYELGTMFRFGNNVTFQASFRFSDRGNYLFSPFYSGFNHP
jgi:hypothetical protein